MVPSEAFTAASEFRPVALVAAVPFVVGTSAVSGRRIAWIDGEGGSAVTYWNDGLKPSPCASEVRSVFVAGVDIEGGEGDGMLGDGGDPTNLAALSVLIRLSSGATV